MYMDKLKISFLLNTIILMLVIVFSIFMFAGVKFMADNTLLEASWLEMFKFYTVDSNIFMGVVSFIFIIFYIRFIHHKIKEIPRYVYFLKFMGTSGIMLTFIVTALFLVPQYGFYAMYSNNNLFFHLIIPVISFISYVFFERYDNKYRYAFIGLIPMFLYSIYYISNILIHLEGNKNIYLYDFYGFLQGDISHIYIVIPCIYLFSYVISILLIFLNKKFVRE